MFEVKSADDVFKILKEYFADYDAGNEKINIFEAAGRIIAEDVISEEDIPGFHRSSVDGFAVIAADTFGASDSFPAQLKLVGDVKMGETPAFSLKNGEAASIPTGGELPENANAVVMVEYTDIYDDGYVYVNKAAAPGNSVVFKGDDTKKGSLVIKKGSVIRPQEAGILAAIGFSEVSVKKRLKVGVISTGDEVVPAGCNVTGSQVRDANAPMLCAGIRSFDADPVYYGIVKDKYEEIENKAATALDECDIVLLSGGSSVGERDQTAKVIESFGAPGILVHGIAVKPGKPTIIGKVKGKAVIGLPGHPASAYMIFRIFVNYLMELMAESKYTLTDKNLNTGAEAVTAEMFCNYPSNNGRDEYISVTLEYIDGKPVAKPIFGKSGLVSMLSAADGFVHIKRSSEGLQKGQAVKVTRF